MGGRPEWRNAYAVGRRVSKVVLLVGILGACNAAPANSGQGPKATPENTNAPEAETTQTPQDPEPGPEKPEPSAEQDPGQESSESEPDPEVEPKFDIGVGEDFPDGQTGDDCDCTERAKSIFLLGANAQLFVYHPVKNTFEELPAYDCDFPEGSQVHSLGVDRNSVAWVQVRPSGDIFKVDTLKNNQCSHSGNVPGQAGITNAGMCFVEHPLDGRCEQLYLHSAEGDDWFERPNAGLLAVLDPEGASSKQIGPINFNGGELTGTADGRLFALAGVPDAKLLEYDPKTAKVIKQTPLPGVNTSGAFAFAFWGGDFYFFTDTFANQNGAFVLTSKVTKLDYDGSGELSDHLEATPKRIVGAGVSICAPLDPPQ